MSRLKAGLSKIDITPRVGVELCGFGPYLCRHSIGVRDRLWARALALEWNDKTFMIVTCDLAGVPLSITQKVRQLLRMHIDISEDAVMVACSHTHSGPNVRTYTGWGEADPTYVERLPYRIVHACLAAYEKRQAAELAHAEVPCEQIGVNREYDEDAQPLDRVLKDDWYPEKPELTDTTCHVLTVEAEADQQLLGFVSYFGCHPVVSCQANRYIHGDFCGVATNRVEDEYPGSVGLFIQGANGDVNSCVVHKGEEESLDALDTIASRYARSLRDGIQQAKKMDSSPITSVIREETFSRVKWSIDELRNRLDQHESTLYNVDDGPTMGDESREVRMSTIMANALRKLIRKSEAGQSLVSATELQGVRLGPITILSSGFETFQAIKNHVVENAQGPITWVCFANDTCGYAPDRTMAERGGYAADVVPMFIGTLPYANVCDELATALLSLDKALH